MENVQNQSRRDFIKAGAVAGGGLALGFYLPGKMGSAQADAGGGYAMPNAWVKIAKAQIDTLKLDCVFQEYPNGGHEWFPQENAKVLEWMGTRRRSAYPARVGVETVERIFNRSWLYAGH